MVPGLNQGVMQLSQFPSSELYPCFRVSAPFCSVRHLKDPLSCVADVLSCQGTPLYLSVGMFLIEFCRKQFPILFSTD